MGGFTKLIFAAGVSLTLSACNNGTAGDGSDVAEGEPIAKIEAPAGQSWADMAAVTPEGGVIVGNPEAPLKVVEYASHTCGACASFSAQAKDALKDKYIASGVVNFELRNLVRDGLDLTIAQLVRCGEPQSTQPLADQAWASMNDFFANGEALNAAMQLSEEKRYVGIAEAAGLFDFFSARGISRDQATQCLSDPAKARAILENSQQQADELKISSTPTFLLNGRNIGNHAWSSLEPLLQRAGAR